MVTSELENRRSDPDGLVAAAQQFLAALDEQAQIRERRQEGRAIADIVESLGLPSSVVAAVLVYPLLRDGLLTKAHLESSDIAGLAGITHGLVQLGSFRLPPDWQPGEALAVQQSEALRKMLLAVVSDVRLVLVRIAEQLYRLRCAKNAPMDEQQALAIETREIYAALANRLAVCNDWESFSLGFAM